MKIIEKIKLIEIEWQGPFKELSKFDKMTDFGLYQIYGTHSIFGPDSLLYIGKAAQQYLSTRYNQHTGWLTKEHSALTFYIGRFGGIEEYPSDTDWTSEIDIAEKLLIYYCSPPYNSQYIVDYGIDNTKERTVILNFGFRHRLPFEVSNLSKESEWGKSEWKNYSYREIKRI